MYQLEQFTMMKERLEQVRRVTKTAHPLIMIRIIGAFEEYPDVWWDVRKMSLFLERKHPHKNIAYGQYRLAHYIRVLWHDGMLVRKKFLGGRCRNWFYRLKR